MLGVLPDYRGSSKFAGFARFAPFFGGNDLLGLNDSFNFDGGIAR